jgi:muconolactone delta-isomerase
MRYLVTWKMSPIPPDMAGTAIALLKASKAQVDKDKKEGTIPEFWTYADGTGGMALVEVESNDALAQRLANEPYAPFLTFAVTPLCDYEMTINTAINNLQKMIA